MNSIYINWLKKNIVLKKTYKFTDFGVIVLVYLLFKLVEISIFDPLLFYSHSQNTKKIN